MFAGCWLRRHVRMPIACAAVAALLLVDLPMRLTGMPAGRALAAQDKAKASADELERGRQLMQRHEYFDAFKAFKRANDLAGGRSADAHIAMAQALTALKLHKHVIETCDAAIPLAEGNARLLARAHSFKGLALEALAETDPGRLTDAEAEFRAALAADPESRIADLHFNLGMVLMRQRRDEEGIAELRREIEIRPHGSTADQARSLIANPRRAREKYAPDFAFTASDGRAISLETLRGSVVLLDFWGTWCPPCVRAVPSLRKLQKAHVKDPFVILGISSDTDERQWRDFTAKNAMVWPQYLDRDREVQRAFGVEAFPTYVLLDAEGIERLRIVGRDFGSPLADAIDQQLKTAPGGATGR